MEVSADFSILLYTEDPRFFVQHHCYRVRLSIHALASDPQHRPVLPLSLRCKRPGASVTPSETGFSPSMVCACTVSRSWACALQMSLQPCWRNSSSVALRTRREHFLRDDSRAPLPLRARARTRSNTWGRSLEQTQRSSVMTVYKSIRAGSVSPSFPE